MRRLGAVAALVAVLLLHSAPPASANGPVPSLLGGWHWPNGSGPSYAFATSMSLKWMRNEAAAGIAASGSTPYQNPVFRMVASTTPNVTVGMRPTPAPCVGSVPTVWYACTRSSSPYTSWSVDLSSSFCWMNGGRYRTCANALTFDVWSVVDHEFLHVSGLDHHWPNQPWSSVMLPAFPSYPSSYWQNRQPRSHDLWGLALLYPADPCTSSPCPQRTTP